MLDIIKIGLPIGILGMVFVLSWHGAMFEKMGKYSDGATQKTD